MVDCQCVKMNFKRRLVEIQTTFFKNQASNLTHCGRVTQICVFTLQLCKTNDANLRF